MPTVHRFHVVPRLPAPLERLREIAYNLWWTWAPVARDLAHFLPADAEDLRHQLAEATTSRNTSSSDGDTGAIADTDTRWSASRRSSAAAAPACSCTTACTAVPKMLVFSTPGEASSTRIVSTGFNMEYWIPDRTDFMTAEQGCEGSWCTAHLWIVPAKFAGSYTIPAGELALAQEFQVLSGTLKSASGEHKVSGTVRGPEAFFTAGGRTYHAKLNGRSLELLP